PDPATSAGSVVLLFPTAVAKTSGISWTATVATNDTGSTASFQVRTFCGFCRDADGTLNFQNPARICWQNGAAVGPACSGTFESCEQRTNGAFGPAAGAVKTIVSLGSTAGPLNDMGAHAATLASVFCIPPSFNASIDASSDIPGPGALAMPESLQLC